MSAVIPNHTLNSFSCPHCNAISHQSWFSTLVKRYGKDETPIQFRPDLEEWLKSEKCKDIPRERVNRLIESFNKQQSGKIFNAEVAGGYELNQLGNLHLSKCYSCDEYTLWLNYKIIWPEQNASFTPADDMPDDVRLIYNEASSLFNKSPRASAALLRLAIETLCNSLNGKKQNIYKGIGDLVKKGLNEKTQQALDIVRVIGNDAVHPGQININDNPEIAAKLFRLVNVIVEELISLPAEINAIYDGLPETKKDAVKKRDGK